MPYDPKKAVSFAQSKSGRYSDGECWTLAKDAIVDAGGAKPASIYVWGAVVQASMLKPGDVLQFNGYVWQREVKTEVTYPQYHPKGDTIDTAQPKEERGLPQHTAIVVNVVSPGIVDVIEQNMPATTGPVQTVQLVLIARPKSETTTRQTVTYKENVDGAEPRTLTGDIVTKVTITETVAHPPICYRPT